MKPIAKAYAIIVSVIGVLLGVYCVYLSITGFINSNNLRTDLIQFAILFLLAYLCRCLPIYIRPDFAIDMAFISNFAIVLCKGPSYASAIVLIGSIFMVSYTQGPERKLVHILNNPPLKTAFNAANLTISVFLGGKVFVWAGGIVANLSFPGVLLPSVAMIFTIIFTNSILLILLFKFNIGTPFFKSVVKYLIDFLPSVISAAPIGYFIAKFITMESGEYLVILFILPLLLARFSFTLYIDAKQNFYVMLKTLTYSIEAKDEYTRGHSERVEAYAKIIAEEMHMSHHVLENISVAALLHDVGKIGIDESILTKPSLLSGEERALIEKHPEISVHILKEVKLAPIVFEMILHHHERYDGKGYPSGLLGEDLPIEVFVLSVADTYDAMTSTRPYSPGLSSEQAKQVIIEEKGKQFHPKVVDAFVKAYEKNKLQLIVHDYAERELFK
ncbi:MAG: HD-GYP domain-containing protein [Oscillospiraceae bacterium]|nr:HD-GYP domain-containing protein [Oscillospiraceae bacterium]